MNPSFTCLALCAVLCFGSMVSGASPVVLTWATNSSIKVQQLLGEEGATNAWTAYAPDTDRQTGAPLLNQTYTLYGVGGSDLGYNFEDGNNRLIFLFGDTLNFSGGDTMAWSSTITAGNKLALNFFTNSDGSTLLVQPPGVDMGAFNVPDSAISVNGNTYVVCKTGHTQATGDTNDFSVLTRFEPASNSFVPLRTISALTNGGHFIEMAACQVGAGFGSQTPTIYLFGAGKYRGSDVYLASVPAAGFESGAGTLYFSGLASGTNGPPTWSTIETDAVPVVVDNPTNGPAWPTNFPTVGNISVNYCPAVGLWLMTYDGGRQSSTAAGVYFCYASAPWGPWSTPVLIFNDKRDSGLGSFIYSPAARYQDTSLAGPVIGTNVATTTPGGSYAPYQVARFTEVNGNALRLYYTLSTWNPYTVVLMKSDFQITTGLGTSSNWVATWAASPIAPTSSDTNNAGFTNQTLRIITHTSAGGGAVRVRLANIFGTNALVIGSAHLALAASGASIVPGTDAALTFNGAGGVTIPAGGMALSDGLAMNVPGFSNLAVSLYISGTAGPATWHHIASQTNYVSVTGDFSASSLLPVQHSVTSSYYLVGVEVLAPSNVLGIVTLGDSITDGYRSTPDANHRWPDDLAAQLAAANNGFAMADAGIAGNRLLQDDVGPSGLSRFDRDVLSQPGVGYVIVLLGINDIGHSTASQPVTAGQLIAGYEELASRAHSQGLKIFGGTITPFGRVPLYGLPPHESLRQTVNAFLRSNAVFDGCIDFDAAVRDPATLTNLNSIYDSGDHLHPNDAGYAAMAAVITNSLFQGSAPTPFRFDMLVTFTGNASPALAWSDVGTGFVLQEASSLDPPVNWVFSPLTPALSNGLFSVSVPGSTNGARFFRLVGIPSD